MVEFYPQKNKKNKHMVGTIHIYCIDCELDIRGISINKHGKKNIYFNMPHYTAIDEETGENVKYPHIRWTNEKTHNEMLDFLYKQVKPIILKRLEEAKTQKKESENGK